MRERSASVFVANNANGSVSYVSVRLVVSSLVSLCALALTQLDNNLLHITSESQVKLEVPSDLSDQMLGGYLEDLVIPALARVN